MLKNEAVMALEEVFVHSENGEYWSPSGFSEEFWQRYDSVFTNLIVVARVKCGVPPSQAVKVPSHIGFICIPSYNGLLGTLLHLPMLFFRAFLLPRHSRYILRAPGAVSLICGIVLKARRINYAIELVGDIDDVLRAVLPKLPYYLVSFPVSFATRKIVFNARAVAYVTKSTLQKKYPHSTGAVTSFYSSVLIEEVVGEKPPPSQGEPIRLISAGTFSQSYKGFDIVVRAVAEMVKNGVNVKAIIAGDGHLREQYKLLAESLGVSEHIDFCGKLSREQILNKMDLSDIYVSASRTEGLPRVIIEAMSRGLPVISTPVGGCIELVLPENLFGIDDVDGLVEKVERIYFDSSLWDFSMKHSCITAREFFKEKMENHRRVFLEKL